MMIAENIRILNCERIPFGVCGQENCDRQWGADMLPMAAQSLCVLVIGTMKIHDGSPGGCWIRHVFLLHVLSMYHSRSDHQATWTGKQLVEFKSLNLQC